MKSCSPTGVRNLSLPHSLTPSLPLSLSPSLSLSLPPSLPHSLLHSLTHSLTPPHFLSPYPPLSLFSSLIRSPYLSLPRHLGVPHTISIDQRLHTGRWRQYAFVLSGHFLQFYYDCQLVFSDIIALPDFCVDEESFVVTFADDSDGSDVGLNNGIHVSKIFFPFEILFSL